MKANDNDDHSSRSFLPYRNSTSVASPFALCDVRQSKLWKTAKETADTEETSGSSYMSA
eukprot:CAMPEP_0206196704 /NCGR_PEP_ID=MMETSP0166-20121206/8615_1 /ASSEMBLY_ACC=CAM_ASM_000260 /TAXON_ID=95228 /ORGANISM="Vannella robusta, Strain DIVA3 518/3/11/1/6" /LENGTH=58 /DNA_ID=CAMNT_0053614247 /DNA_START=302 /DNA_END=475 /DNA_ORIENTATION=+